MISKVNLLKIRISNAICGFIYLLCVLLSKIFLIDLLYAVGTIALIQIFVSFFKISPIISILDKLMTDSEPINQGRW